MNSIKLIIALSLTASVPTVLHAQTTDLPTISVATADLNLATRAGQDRLAMRIDQAAKRVCDNGSSTGDLRGLQATKTCITKAKSQAMLEVSNRTSPQVALTAGH